MSHNNYSKFNFLSLENFKSKYIFFKENKYHLENFFKILKAKNIVGVENGKTGKFSNAYA